jgi:hypothetical protein
MNDGIEMPYSLPANQIIEDYINVLEPETATRETKFG